MLFTTLSTAGRLALMVAVGLLISLPSVVDGVDAPTTPVIPTKPQLDDADNPFGVKVNYTVAWLNKDQKAFGASLIVTCTKPQPDPSWAIRIQFASGNTKIVKFWGPWNLNRYETSWYLAVPVSNTPGQPAIASGDTAPHSYSFNGAYTGDDINSIYPNGYTLAKDEKSDIVVLTPNEARNTPLSPDIPTAPYGEFNRQQKSAGGATGTTPATDSSLTSASGTNNPASDSSSNTGIPLIGLCIFGGVLAVGLTVVGVATHRRRQNRLREFRAHPAMKPPGNKSSDTTQSREAPITVPEPTAINNHSTSARAAAGAVVMQEMGPPEQAVAHDYYMDEEQQVEAEVDHAYYNQYDDGQFEGQYEEVQYEGQYEEAQYENAQYENAQYEEAQHEGQYEGQYEEPQKVEPETQTPKSQVYVEGLPSYAVQYDNDDGELEAEAIYNAAAANVNSAVEHVDLRPPVAQEYYVADTVAYDEAQHDRTLSQVDASSQLEYAGHNNTVIYSEEGAVYNEETVWPEGTYGGGEQDYNENAVYGAEGLPPVGTEDYTAYEATEFEAADFNSGGSHGSGGEQQQ